MSAIDCLLKKASLGRVSKDHARAIEELYQQKIDAGSSVDDAAKSALDEFRGMSEGELSPRQQNLFARGAQSAKAYDQAVEYLKGRKGYDLKEAIRELSLDKVYERQRDISTQYSVPLIDTYKALKKTRFHTPSAQLSDELIMGMYGKQTNPQNNAMVDTIKKVITTLNSDFADRAGKIADVKDTSLPFYFNVSSIKNITADEFINIFEGKINWDNFFKNTPELTNKSTTELLNLIYDRIVNNSLDRSVSYRRIMDSIRITSPEDFITLNKTFGMGDIMTILAHFIENNSKEIARRDILGYSPQKMLSSLVKEFVPTEADQLNKTINNNLNYLNGMYKIGAPEAYVKFLDGAKSTYAATKLVKTSIQAYLTDPYFRVVKRYLMGFEPFNGLLSAFKLSSSEDKKLAIKLGLMAQANMESSSSALRMINLSQPMVGLDKVTQGSMMISYLTQLTENARGRNMVSAALDFADLVGTPFDKLPKNTQISLKNGLISVSEWNSITKDMLYIEQYHGHDVPLLSPLHIADNFNKELGQKLATIMGNIREASTPTSWIGARAALQRLASSDNVGIGATLASSVGMFTGFSSSVYQYILKETFRRGLNTFTGGAMVAAVLIGYAVPTALYIQAKRALEYKDPLPINSDTFWKQIITNSPLWNQLTNFLTSGGDHIDILGPLGNTIGSAKNIIAKNLEAVKQGKETHISRDLVGFFTQNIPGGPLYLAGEALKRLLIEPMQYKTDPAYYHSLWQKMDKREIDKGSGYISKPGSGKLPNRFPDFSKLWRKK